jgi:excisionase family DNA binding protein
MTAEPLLVQADVSGAPKLLLTQREAAEACALCEKSLYLAVKRGELRAVKIGRAVRYDPRDLAAWIDRHRTRANEAPCTAPEPAEVQP